jgi:hypothetical protein
MITFGMDDKMVNISDLCQGPAAGYFGVWKCYSGDHPIGEKVHRVSAECVSAESLGIET